MSVRLAPTSVSSSDTGRLRIVRSWHVDTEDEIFDVVADNVSYRGLTRSPAYTAETWENDTIECGYRVELTFEGVDLTNGRLTPEYAKWDFDPSFEKEPIEKHPAIAFIIENYKGSVGADGRVVFPEKIERNRALGFSESLTHWQGGGKGNTTTYLVDNPLYGLNESGYLELGGVATARYNTTDPAQANRGIARIFDDLPHNAPDYGVEDGRNWLKAPSRINELEPVDGDRWYAVEEIYLLSVEGGWPPAVYKLIST
jgi:hypothetical protein